MARITGDMTIGDAIRKHPEILETLLSFGLHCIGCGVAHAESLEQGMRSHGFSDEDVKEAIKLLNAVIAKAPQPTVHKPVVLTDKAVAKIKEILKKENKKRCGLRIEVIPGGCSGFRYALNIEEKPSPDDRVIEDKGIKIFIDSQSLERIKGAKVDYVEALQGAGFKITNPAAVPSRGCGQSVS